MALQHCAPCVYIESSAGGSEASSPRTTSSTVSTTASAAGTQQFAARWANQFVGDFFRPTRSELTVSSIAVGTYLGESDDAPDAMYAEAGRRALTSGVNTIDTAINYRCQRSERVVGRVLRE